eukprot:COSAG05_NODE_4494_length_1490_cov_1.629044_1_plen_442_part_01
MPSSSRTARPAGQGPSTRLRVNGLLGGGGRNHPGRRPPAPATADTNPDAKVAGRKEFAVGDCVVCRSDGGEVSVCEVLGQRQDSTGERFILCRWFYRPEETPGGRLPSHGCCELFSSEEHSIDIAPADTVLCKCRVLSAADYAKELSAAAKSAICAASDGVCTPERLASPAGRIPVGQLDEDASWVDTPFDTTGASELLGRMEKMEARRKCVNDEVGRCLDHLLGRVVLEVDYSKRLSTSYSTTFSLQTARTASSAATGKATAAGGAAATPSTPPRPEAAHAAAGKLMRNVYYSRAVYSSASMQLSPMPSPGAAGDSSRGGGATTQRTSSGGRSSPTTASNTGRALAAAWGARQCALTGEPENLDFPLVMCPKRKALVDPRYMFGAAVPRPVRPPAPSSATDASTRRGGAAGKKDAAGKGDASARSRASRRAAARAAPKPKR